MAFGQRASTATTTQKSAPAVNAGPKEDHYADVTEMVSAEGKTSKYMKFVQDVQGDNGLFIPKGTIFTYETYEDIHNRTPNPTQKQIDWLNSRSAPFVTPKGVTLTGIGQVKKPFKPSA